MKFGIVVFPGTNRDGDAFDAVTGPLGATAVRLWHKDHDLQGADVIILPGGFSYGDYLRAGAIARFSPIMQEVIAHASAGGPVIGICNGFQIACEAHLLPGALLRNASLQFRSQPVTLRVETNDTRFTNQYRKGQLLRVPIAHGDGRFVIDAEGLDRLEANGQVVFRYADANGQLTDAANPNGSLDHIAGIVNERGNVLGLMPHPENAIDARQGSRDGLGLFESVLARVNA
ncbi:MAG: phosphoribosylformylglycinamidine synthase subunit PurQ [Gemmatimonadaceae bacterium]|nr:phosphoribosylformylglycinamidine synthase subunit PurQ [Gemmatimonadaceae bacterium]